MSRLGSMTHDFGGSATTHDLTLGFAYNPASQIVEATRSNNLYTWTGHGSGTTSSTTNGLNQLASHGGATPTHDSKGNLTSDGTYTYAYSSENLLTSFGATGTLGYDPLMRFYENYSTYFVHEGGQLVGEYYNGNIVARYVPGAAGDEPVAQIDKFGARTGFHADERGSIIAGSNSAGANSRIVTYDEYGKRGPGGSYRFAFTGQVHLLNDIYDYKARNYNARLGRFVQTDPIGYGAGMNIYAYVGGDPVNFTDPSGLQEESVPVENIIFVTGQREERPALTGWAALIGAKSGDQSRFMANLLDLLGGGGGGVGGPLEPVDPCAAKETPPREGQSFAIDEAQFASKAAEKYNQHSWPLNDRGNRQSVFGGKITSPAELASRALYLVTTRDAVPSGGLNVRITGDLGVHTGRDIRSPLPRTTYLTVIFGPPNGTRDGLPLRPAVSMHPGC